MTSVSSAERQAAKREQDGATLVSGYKLGAHLGMSRQNIDTLAAQGVLTRRRDGLFDLDASRLAYLQHLREGRRSPRVAADAEHALAKTEMLRLRVAKERRELMPTADHNAFVDELAGMLLTRLSSLPARVAGVDLAMRRKVEAAVLEWRREFAEACNKLADARGEPPE
jgi:hypothetical protein